MPARPSESSALRHLATKMARAETVSWRDVSARIGVLLADSPPSVEDVRLLRTTLARRADEAQPESQCVLALLSGYERQLGVVDSRREAEAVVRRDSTADRILRQLAQGPSLPSELALRVLGQLKDDGRISRALQKLERSGLIEHADPVDGRSRPRRLTARGLTVASRGPRLIAGAREQQEHTVRTPAASAPPRSRRGRRT